MALVNKPSQLLSDEINNIVFTKMLKPNCISLVTTLATFAYNFNGTFGPKTAGVLCFECDSSSGLHYLRLYNMDTNQMFFDELVGHSGIEFTSDDPPSFFEIQFASGIYIGLWFLPEPEAEAEARDLEKNFLSVFEVETPLAGNPARKTGGKAKKKNRKGARARRRARHRATKAAAESPSKTESQLLAGSSEDQSDEEAMNLMDTLKEQLLARQLTDLNEMRAQKDSKKVVAAKIASQTKTASPSTTKKPSPPPTIVVQPPSPHKPTSPSPQKPTSPTPQKPTSPTATKQPQSPQKPTASTATKQPPSPQKTTPPIPAIVVQPPSAQKPTPPATAIKVQSPAAPNTSTTSMPGTPVKSPGRKVKFEDDDADFQTTQDIAAKWQQKREANQKNAGQGG